VVIRCQASDWLIERAKEEVLPQAALDGSKVVVNDHAGTGFCCMNWRTGSEVR